MNTKARQISVSGLRVEVVRKDIKNLHLGVYPPHGRVRVAAPLAVGDNAIRLAVIGKLGWIKRRRERFDAQPRQSRREMVSGESHYFLGRRYRLRVVEHAGVGRVLCKKSVLEMYVRAETDAAQREEVLNRWYRNELRKVIPPLVEKWQAALGVRPTGVGIKRMKTKWGSCSIAARRIWLNLELAKKPVECLEYVVVHELVHLRERHHNERFIALMDKHLPQWRLHRDVLNATPLGHERWDY